MTNIQKIMCKIELWDVHDVMTHSGNTRTAEQQLAANDIVVISASTATLSSKNVAYFANLGVQAALKGFTKTLQFKSINTKGN